MLPNASIGNMHSNGLTQWGWQEGSACLSEGTGAGCQFHHPKIQQYTKSGTVLEASCGGLKHIYKSAQKHGFQLGSM